ncbi:hypothetical protein BJ741DRAFT_650039 [Chytriomyces cf. hyalinus JEL632]|nr:hypothetical protein BJ741DRAFT_650039 [Chytriomyces cf. hyalinus JEL632]
MEVSDTMVASQDGKDSGAAIPATNQPQNHIQNHAQMHGHIPSQMQPHMQVPMQIVYAPAFNPLQPGHPGPVGRGGPINYIPSNMVAVPHYMHLVHPHPMPVYVPMNQMHTLNPSMGLVAAANHPQLSHVQRKPAQLSPCYCGVPKPPNYLRPNLQCRVCAKMFHYECIDAFKAWKIPPFLGDDFFIFNCRNCSQRKVELLQRQSMVYSDIAHLALFQMTHQATAPSNVVWCTDRAYRNAPPAPKMGPTDLRPYFTRKQLGAFVDANWDRFWLKQRASTWTHSLMSALLGGGGGNSNTVVAPEELRFLTGKEQFPGDSSGPSFLALHNKEQYPSMIESKRPRGAAYDILLDGTIVEFGMTEVEKIAMMNASAANALASNVGSADRTEGVMTPPINQANLLGAPSKKKENKRLGGAAQGVESDNESVGSRKGSKGARTPELRSEPEAANKKKKPNSSGASVAQKMKPRPRELEPEEIDQANSVVLYPDLNNPEHGPVTLSFEVTHTAPQMKLSPDGLTIFTEKGYRMSKATHGVYEGCWYYEVEFHSNEKGHARVGWSQISGDLQAPCGCDVFSYSFRDSPGTLFHQSAHVKGNDAFSAGYKDGDVLGIMINLPPPNDMDNMVRRLWKLDSSYVQFRTKPLEKVIGSEIRYFKNGVELGTAFTDLYNGKYYPAVSSYQHGTLTLNFGPNFAHALPTGARPYSDVPKVHAWADLALYSYEPFHVSDREPVRPPTSASIPMASPPRRKERDGLFGIGFPKKPKKKRRLVKKSALGVEVVAERGDAVVVGNDTAVNSTDAEAVNARLEIHVTDSVAAVDGDKPDSGELVEEEEEDGQDDDDSDVESNETGRQEQGTSSMAFESGDTFGSGAALDNGDVAG